MLKAPDTATDRPSYSSGGRDIKHAAAILLVGFALGGCATFVGTIPGGLSLDASDESVVVGRVEMVRLDGQPLLSGLALLGRMSLMAEHETSRKTYVIECDTRGLLSDFYVSLPSGRYRITGWKTVNLDLALKAWFDVPRREVVYVGTLRFTGTAILPIFWYTGFWLVVDSSENTLRSFRERFPQLQQTVAKSLISISYE